jgi:shikimate kinase
MDSATRERIRANAVSVWLKADLDTLVDRVGRRNNRPLLKNGDPRQILEGLIAIRYPVYAEADITVETGHAPPATTVERVVEALAARRSAAEPAARARRA